MEKNEQRFCKVSYKSFIIQLRIETDVRNQNSDLKKNTYLSDVLWQTVEKKSLVYHDYIFNLIPFELHPQVMRH